jgi:hypothetical protein
MEDNDSRSTARRVTEPAEHEGLPEYFGVKPRRRPKRLNEVSPEETLKRFRGGWLGWAVNELLQPDTNSEGLLCVSPILEI